MVWQRIGWGKYHMEFDIMLRVEMVHKGEVCWIGGREGWEVVVGELDEDGSQSVCWFIGEGGWLAVVVGVIGLFATSGNILFFH